MTSGTCVCFGFKIEVPYLCRFAMEDFLRALAILILLRCGNVRLAPLFRSWKDVDMEDLFDLHYVMC